MAYYFGGLKEYSLEQIESEVLNESIYLDVFAGSDLRLKTNVKEIPTSLESLKKLDVIMYNWTPEVQNKLISGSGDQVGLVAQQVAEVFPELVKKDQDTGYLTVNYQKLTAHLLVAIKELSGQIADQKQQIENIQSQLNS